MTVKGVLVRFFLLYIVLMFVAGIAMDYFSIESTSAVGIAILLSCILWVCGEFGKKNGRYFTGIEKSAVVIGIIVIDISLQYLVGVAVLSDASVEIRTDAFNFAIGIVGALHAVAIYFAVSITKKSLIKQGIISA